MSAIVAGEGSIARKLSVLITAQDMAFVLQENAGAILAGQDQNAHGADAPLTAVAMGRAMVYAAHALAIQAGQASIAHNPSTQRIFMPVFRAPATVSTRVRRGVSVVKAASAHVLTRAFLHALLRVHVPRQTTMRQSN